MAIDILPAALRWGGMHFILTELRWGGMHSILAELLLVRAGRGISSGLSVVVHRRIWIIGGFRSTIIIEMRTSSVACQRRLRRAECRMSGVDIHGRKLTGIARDVGGRRRRNRINILLVRHLVSASRVLLRKHKTYQHFVPLDRQSIPRPPRPPLPPRTTLELSSSLSHKPRRRGHVGVVV